MKRKLNFYKLKIEFDCGENNSTMEYVWITADSLVVADAFQQMKAELWCIIGVMTPDVHQVVYDRLSVFDDFDTNDILAEVENILSQFYGREDRGDVVNILTEFRQRVIGHVPFQQVDPLFAGSVEIFVDQ